MEKWSRTSSPSERRTPGQRQAAGDKGRLRLGIQGCGSQRRTIRYHWLPEPSPSPPGGPAGRVHIHRAQTRALDAVYTVAPRGASPQLLSRPPGPGHSPGSRREPRASIRPHVASLCRGSAQCPLRLARTPGSTALPTTPASLASGLSPREPPCRGGWPLRLPFLGRTSL